MLAPRTGSNVALFQLKTSTLALAEPPAVLVAQLGLPLIDGVQLGGILHANPRTNSVELIFLADTAAAAGPTELDGEVVAPPADLDALARRVQTLIEKQNSNEEKPDPDGEDSGGVSVSRSGRAVVVSKNKKKKKKEEKKKRFNGPRDVHEYKMVQIDGVVSIRCSTPKGERKKYQEVFEQVRASFVLDLTRRW